MRWYGKLLGFIAGALLFRLNPLFGAVIGLVLGHAYDIGWFSKERDDPYRELGLTADATAAEVDLAYRRLMSRYHPDKVAAASPEQRREAERRASQINAAYDRIQRRRRR